MIKGTEVKPRLKAVVFDRWTVERVDGHRASPLIAIFMGLEQRGGWELMYFDPASFDPDAGELPHYTKQQMEGRPFNPNVIFTYGFNFLPIQDYYRESGHKADIVTVDFGFLKREQGYRYIVKNGALPKTADAARFNQLGVKIEEKRDKENGHVLVLMQNHHQEWYSKAIALVYENAKQGREVRLRHHPKDTEEQRTLEEDMAGAHSVVTYDSTALYQALLARVPVICHEGCIAAEVAWTDFESIEKAEPPTIPKLQGFLNRLAYAQWRIDELKSGIWVPHYFQGY